MTARASDSCLMLDYVRIINFCIIIIIIINILLAIWHLMFHFYHIEYDFLDVSFVIFNTFGLWLPKVV